MLASQGDLSFSFQNHKIQTNRDNLRQLNIPVTLRAQKIGQISLETTMRHLAMMTALSWMQS
jgi:hypothetical protein